MLISEIARNQKTEIERLEADYQQKFLEQANNEKVLRDNNDTL